MCQIFAFKTPYRLALESNGVNFRYTIIKGNKKGKVARVIVFFFLFDFLNAPDERTRALAFLFQ